MMTVSRDGGFPLVFSHRFKRHEVLKLSGLKEEAERLQLVNSFFEHIFHLKINSRLPEANRVFIIKCSH